MAKTGEPSRCEDIIVVTSDFAAVIDGCSRPDAPSWDGLSPGRRAAELLAEAIGQLPPACELQRGASHLTERLRKEYVRLECLDEMAISPRHRLAATMAVYSRQRREVWLIGDCQCRLAGRTHQNTMECDTVLAALRAFYLHLELIAGASLEDLAARDRGREEIQSLLHQQTRFQNETAGGRFAYAVVDGFPIPQHLLRSIPVPAGTSELVLASDGYPALFESLAETEAFLADVLRTDPLMFRRFPATKGRQPGHASFDDRSYLRLRLDPPTTRNIR